MRYTNRLANPSYLVNPNVDVVVAMSFNGIAAWSATIGT